MPIKLRGALGNSWRTKSECFDAKRYKKLIATSPIPNKDFCIVGFHAASNSHSIATRLLIADLKKSGFEPRLMDISEILQSPVDNSGKAVIEPPREDDAIVLVVHPDQLIYALNRLGGDILSNRKIIAYWVFELEAPPKSWKVADGLIHEIWTPSNFSKNALTKMFDCKVTVIPHPVAINEVQKVSKNSISEFRALHEISNHDFVAFQSFSFASSLERKNIFASIDAFNLAFSNGKSAVLLLRYQNAQRFPRSYQRLLKKVTSSKARIILFEAAADQNEVFLCYKIANCYISLHRSEGFGLNIAEAMLHEVPVIATNWSGNTDFVCPESVCLVDYRLIPVKDPDRIYCNSGLKWAEANIETAAKYLLKLRNDKIFAKEISKKAKMKILRDLSGSSFKFPL